MLTQKFIKGKKSSFIWIWKLKGTISQSLAKTIRIAELNQFWKIKLIIRTSLMIIKNFIIRIIKKFTLIITWAYITIITSTIIIITWTITITLVSLTIGLSVTSYVIMHTSRINKWKMYAKLIIAIIKLVNLRIRIIKMFITWW